MRPAPAMVEQVQAQLAAVDRQLRAADARGASYREVYRLVLRENALREQLAQLQRAQEEGSCPTTC